MSKYAIHIIDKMEEDGGINYCQSCDLTIKDFIIISTNLPIFIKFLVSHKLFKREIQCISCRNTADLNINRLVYRCNRRNTVRKNNKVTKFRCNFEKSVRNNTWFSRSKLSIFDIMYITVLWCLLPFPRQQTIMKEVKCTGETVVNWSSYCREVCLFWAKKNSQKLGGANKIVEIDEAKFGKRKYNRGRIVEGQWVFGGFERGSKKVFLVAVEKRDTETLLKIIQEWILPGTTIISDFWKAYDVLQHKGFIHLKINHSLNYVDSNDRSTHTQNIERIWRDVRGGIPRYGRRKNHFVGYLAEFLFKRANKNNVLHSFLENIHNMYPGC